MGGSSARWPFRVTSAAPPRLHWSGNAASAYRDKTERRRRRPGRRSRHRSSAPAANRRRALGGCGLETPLPARTDSGACVLSAFSDVPGSSSRSSACRVSLGLIGSRSIPFNRFGSWSQSLVVFNRTSICFRSRLRARRANSRRSERSARPSGDMFACKRSVTTSLMIGNVCVARFLRVKHTAGVSAGVQNIFGLARSESAERGMKTDDQKSGDARARSRRRCGRRERRCRWPGRVADTESSVESARRRRDRRPPRTGRSRSARAAASRSRWRTRSGRSARTRPRDRSTTSSRAKAIRKPAARQLSEGVGEEEAPPA